MAQFDLESIREAFDGVVTAVHSFYKDILREANKERLELLALYGRMKDTEYHLNTFNGFAREAAEALIDMANEGTELGMAINEVIEGGNESIHIADYENFVGFCEICGGEMTVDSETVKFGDGRAHVECFDVEDEDEEFEKSDEECDVETDDEVAEQTV